MMLKSDLLPPHEGLDADPVLYGIAAALAELFPPVVMHGDVPADGERQGEGDGDRAYGDRE